MSPDRFTPEALQAAWTACRRPSWPADFGACMADPIISRLIMLYALHGRASRWDTGRATPKVQPRPAPAAAQPVPIDRKRLAAGEREED